jgi:hypothetical protein
MAFPQFYDNPGPKSRSNTLEQIGRNFGKGDNAVEICAWDEAFETIPVQPKQMLSKCGV